jgi:hypothetical protein
MPSSLDAPEYEGPWHSDKSLVYAQIVVWPSAVCIHEWSSTAQGQGNTIRAVAELRVRWPEKAIVAYGIGSEPSDKSWQYWVHLASKRVVDELLDDDGVAVQFTLGSMTHGFKL